MMELIIVCILCLIVCGIGLYLIKENNELTGYNNVLLSLIDKRTQELIKEQEWNKQFVVPVAEIKATWSDEDLEKIVKMLKESKVTRCDENGIVIDKKCEHNHIYDSIIIQKDELHCCEYLIFKCSTCGHEEKIRTRRNLLYELVLNGGFRA